MKKKSFMYILLVFLVLFGFSDFVEAKTFQCIYQFNVGKKYRNSVQGNKLKEKLSVMIEQKDGSDPVYKLSFDGATEPGDDSWVDNVYNIEVDQQAYGTRDTALKECPVYASYYKAKGTTNTSRTIKFFKESMSNDEANNYIIISRNVLPVYNNSGNSEEISVEIPPLIIGSDPIDTCEQLFGKDEEDREEMISLLKNLVTILRIAVPIIIIGMGIVDMVKAVFATDEQQMKKAQSSLMKRLIIGVAFFLIPSILKLLLTIGAQAWPDVISSDFCGIL